MVHVEQHTAHMGAAEAEADVVAAKELGDR